jgi:hypothetical protein
MNGAKRTLLGRQAGLALRERVYETADGIEVESNDHYDVTRRRVFFDDVVLVTYHRPFGALFIVINSLFVMMMVGLSASMAAALRTKDAWPVIIFWLIVATPSFIAVLLRLLLRVEVINVYGRRSKATLRYSWRKQHAREVYGRICARVRQAQRVNEPAPERESPELPPQLVPPLP